MIGVGRSQQEINAVREYPVPLVPYHPTAVTVDPETGRKQMGSVTGYTSTATLEPQDEHLVELDWALSQVFGTGVAGTLRGYRVFQSEKSKAIWSKWTSFFKQYKDLIITDFQTLQCSTSCWGNHVPFGPDNSCNVSSWDGVIHWAPKSQFPNTPTRALAILWNPLPDKPITANIQLPVYYAGLVSGETVAVREQGGTAVVEKKIVATNCVGDATLCVHVDVTMWPLGITWFALDSEPAK
jgi:hypothetical protein